jgi:hypothetical protein
MRLAIRARCHDSEYMKPEKTVLRLKRVNRRKLSWEETAKAMAAANEDWSEWDAVTGDGIDGL